LALDEHKWLVLCSSGFVTEEGGWTEGCVSPWFGLETGTTRYISLDTGNQIQSPPS